MTAIEAFDSWFEKLAPNQQKSVLEHIASNYFMKRITEGYYGGPAEIKKGMFAGPGPSPQAACPTCHRPY